MHKLHRPVVMGIAGMGGYAAVIRREVLQAMMLPDPPVKLGAVCEPELASHGEAVAELRAMGVKVVTSLRAMLRNSIGAVWLPVPIDLHRSMAEQSLAAGKAVMCEKPPAGCVDDLDAMIAARDRANQPCAVGYQDIYHPATMLLKERILGGHIGKVRSASVMACWPRDDKYYSRNTWAGRTRRGGIWVMDSPANNAMAHYVNLALFLLGAAANTCAIPESVEAELYRARPIENYDTVSMRLTLRGGLKLLVLLTHACTQRVDPIIQINGEHGTIRAFASEKAEIATYKGSEVIARDGSRQHMIERFARLVCGESDDRAVATLELSRPHLVAINGASEAVPVRNVPDRFIERVPLEHEALVCAIVGIEETFVKSSREGCMLHESGRAPWASPAGRRDLRGYRHFNGPAKA